MENVLLPRKEENNRLSQLAEIDWLTGVYNQTAMEIKVNQILRTSHQGTLLVMDIDNFKMINNRYGHIAGDRVIMGMAHILGKMTMYNEILGRVGGDKFVIFMPVSQEQDYIEARCSQFKQRFSRLSPSHFIVSKLSLAVWGRSYQSGDDYESMFNRAYQSLVEEKLRRREQNSNLAGRTSGRILYFDEESALKADMNQIHQELSGPGTNEGAFCQDFDDFINIYRFMERRLGRKHANIFRILITLTNSRKEFPVLQEREQTMGTLHQIIQHCLGAGDVFTRYSSCQFLLMVSDMTAGQTDAIAEQIRQKFFRLVSRNGKYQLLYDRYP